MTSTLSLSISMGILTKIDANGTKTDFDLTANHGVLIFFSKGEIKIVPASSTPTPDVTVTTIDAQWQVSYHEPTNIAFLVGSVNIDVARTPMHHDFELENGDFQLWMDGTDLKAKLV